MTFEDQVRYGMAGLAVALFVIGIIMLVHAYIRGRRMSAETDRRPGAFWRRYGFPLMATTMSPRMIITCAHDHAPLWAQLVAGVLLSFGTYCAVCWVAANRGERSDGPGRVRAGGPDECVVEGGSDAAGAGSPASRPTLVQTQASLPEHLGGQD